MKNIYLLLSFLPLFIACQKDSETRGFPEVTTLADLVITEDGVLVSAEVKQSSASEIVEYGVVYIPESLDEKENYEKIAITGDPGGSYFSVQIDRNLVAGLSYAVKAYVKTSDRIIYGNQLSFISKGSKSPELTDFYPKEAYVGDTIIISGRYFASKNEDNIIYFGKSQAVPFFSCDTILKVIVPLLSASENILLVVQVAEKETASKDSFSLKQPVIYRFYPEKVLPGQTLKVMGAGFLQVSKVNIDDISNNIQMLTDSTISLTVNTEVTDGEKSVQLFQIDRFVTSDQKLKIIYPEIKSISPTEAWIDTVLTMRGTNLNELSKLTIDYNNLSIIYKSDTLITAKINTVFDEGKIRATFYNKQLLALQSIAFNPPVITAISPGTATYGETVLLTGDRFFSGLTSSLGKLTYINKNQISLEIGWTHNYGTFSVPLSYYSEYPLSSVKMTIPKVEITELTPYEIKRGTELTIKANNLPSKYNAFYMMSTIEGTYLENEEWNDKSMTGVISDYTYCSEYPTVTLVVGPQSIEIEGKLHFNEKWKKLNKVTSVPGTPIYTGVNGKAYAFSFSQSETRILKFDPTEEQWVYVNSTPPQEFSFSIVSCSLGSDVYFIGNNAVLNNAVVFRYSLDKQSWTKISDFPEPLFGEGYGYPFMFALNDNLYAGSPHGFFQYDSENDKWIEKKGLPTTRFYITRPLFFSVNNKGFVAFNTDVIDSDERTEFWEYDPSSDNWINHGSLPMSVYYGGTATVYNERVYLTGKSYRSGDKMIEFDPVNMQFKEMLPPPFRIYGRVYGDFFSYVNNFY